MAVPPLPAPDGAVEAAAAATNHDGAFSSEALGWLLHAGLLAAPLAVVRDGGGRRLNETRHPGARCRAC